MVSAKKTSSYGFRQRAKGERRKMKPACNALRFALCLLPFACTQNYLVRSIYVRLFFAFRPSPFAPYEPISSLNTKFYPLQSSKIPFFWK
jgi:hypothetical protein